MGPIGAGLLYTSAALREKIAPTMVGASMMKQGDDYLNHTWDPVQGGEIYEYSTVPIAQAMGMDAILKDVFLRYGIENIQAEIFRLQDIALEVIDRSRLKPLVFDAPNRSGILSLAITGDASRYVKTASEQGIICTVRGGYLRIAPHFYTTEQEIERAVSVLNRI